VDKEPKKNKNLNSLFQHNWERITEVVLEAQRRKNSKKLPFTYYYQKSGILLGSFFCGDEEGVFVLFFNLDYGEPSLILELIAQHCQILQEEIFVYPLEGKGIKLYETVTPNNFKIVEL
jgi:hypothetical protein